MPRLIYGQAQQQQLQLALIEQTPSPTSPVAKSIFMMVQASSAVMRLQGFLCPTVSAMPTPAMGMAIS
ncbi:hypothetical protein [Croceicoccus estronivorus]|uniref:hypothetical protein n=1 Tax=Croceicoccus estronivorus TaxID=1172626 RepID=UPI001F251893|nr:hypothetical protein [Croceicoccus estronivorus]